MQVTTLTPAQVGEFRKLSQPPVRQWAEKEIGKDYVQRLFGAIDKAKRS
jgi:hypothetical protein